MALKRRTGTGGGTTQQIINQTTNLLANLDLAIVRINNSATVQAQSAQRINIYVSDFSASDDIEEFIVGNSTLLKIRAGKKYNIAYAFYAFASFSSTELLVLRQSDSIGTVGYSGALEHTFYQQFSNSRRSPRNTILDLTGDLERELDGFVYFEIAARNTHPTAQATIPTTGTLRILSLTNNEASADTGLATGGGLTAAQTAYLEFLMTQLFNENGLELHTSNGRFTPEHLAALRTVMARGIIQPTAAGVNAQAILNNIQTLSFGNNEPNIQYIQDGALFNLNPHYLRSQIQKFKYMQENLGNDTASNANQPYELFQRSEAGNLRLVDLPLFSIQDDDVDIGHLHGIRKESATAARVERAGFYRIQAKTHFRAVQGADPNQGGVRSAFDVNLVLSRLQPASTENRFTVNTQEYFDSGYMRGAGQGAPHTRADATFSTVIRLNENDIMKFQCRRYTPDESTDEFVYLADDRFSTVILERLHD